MDDAYVFFDEIPLVQTPRTNEPTLKVSAVTSSPSPHSSSPVTSLPSPSPPVLSVTASSTISANVLSGDDA